MGGKGGTKIEMPEQIDAGQAMGEYLFGQDFSSFKGVTDPALQERLLGAEATYRPQYQALELADIATMARGISDPKQDPRYGKLQAELAGLEAGTGGVSDEEARKIAQRTVGLKPSEFIDPPKRVGRPAATGRGSSKPRKIKNPNYEEQLRAYNAEVNKISQSLGGNNDARIAQIKTEMQGLEQAGGTPGLFDLLEESSERAGTLQREQLGLQRADDVAALEKFAPQVVEAQRAADPYSTALAEQAQQLAGQDLGLATRGQEMLDAQLQDASRAEKRLLRSGVQMSDAQLQAASEAEQRLLQSGAEMSDAQLRAASQAEQKLLETGGSLADLTPTEQEAILAKRGMEFAASTGELTPLERRRAQQSARQASLARGRGMDQSALYGEMSARMAEELNKREREIGLGADLIGQEASMRGARIGQGADLLSGAESMSAQRRAEQLQRQQFGADLLSGAERLAAQRRAEQLQRQQFGAGLLSESERLASLRRAEQLQRQQMGAGLIGQEAGIRSQQLGQAFGMNRALAGDLGATILGRPSSAINLGGSVVGQAQAGAAGQMGPQLFDPNAGINMAMQNQSNQFSLLGAQAQADATSNAGFMSGLGSAIGAFTLPCWVAREVYGIDNPKWLMFRTWLENDAPAWFHNLYIKHGERFAKFISNKPVLKTIIRKWMNTRIK